MASETRGSDGTPPAGDRVRRPAPTIDLTATEISKEPSGPRDMAAENHATPAEDSGANEPPRFEHQGPDAHESESGPAGVGDSDRESASVRFSTLPWGLLAAGLIGAILVVGLSSLMSYMGWVGPNNDEGADLDARLAPIERQLQALANRPPSLPAVAPKALADLSARVDKAEAALARPPSQKDDTALTDRVASTESALKSLTDSIAALKQRTESLATTTASAQAGASEASDLAGRMAALETAVKKLTSEQKTLADDVQQQAKNSANARTMRQALLAANLRSAVERGGPFADELDAVKPFVSDAKLLAPLTPFAATGVASVDTLRRELAGLLPALQKTSRTVESNGGFFDRLQASAERLVRIRRIDETGGNDTGSILARAESKAGQADVDGALAELAKLPPSTRAPVEPWIEKAKARNDAVYAARRIAADAFAALAKASG